MFFIGLLFPFLKSFLGEGVISKYLDHKKDMAASANERDRVAINADVKVIEFELQRRAMQRGLVLKTMEHPYLWWPMFIIMMNAALYVSARLMVKTFGLDDYNIAVTDLDAWEKGVVSTVLAFMFVGEKIERVFRK